MSAAGGNPPKLSVIDPSSIPSIERILQSPDGVDLASIYGRPLALRAIQEAVGQLRAQMLAGGSLPESIRILEEAKEKIESWLEPSVEPLINSTGVLLHTNLGRAPLSSEACAAMVDAAGGYSNLEINLSNGKRGTRTAVVEILLTLITGAEDAFVVNNNAGAVLLALAALAKGKRVIISRTQMIEIGGGFRVPEVMAQSGVKLVEVGTTNRVHTYDYVAAMEKTTGLILITHRSNFKMTGFVTEPSVKDLVKLGSQFGVEVIDDLGSGALLDTSIFGLTHEPMVQESVKDGAGIVCFSGDKLLGGPQAGILVGKADLIGRLKKHPLARALRADKTCLAALNATLCHYLRDEAVEKIPFWKMVSRQSADIRTQALHWKEIIGAGDVLEDRSMIGGGSLPEEALPTWVLSLRVNHPTAIMKALRARKPAVVARIEHGRVIFDPRTVLIGQEETLLKSIQTVIGEN